MDAKPIGVLLVAARREVWSAFCAHARRFRLSGHELWALVTIAALPGITTGGLARDVLLDPPAASRLAAALARRGLVEVRRDPADRRRSRLGLTAAGEALAPRLSAASEAFRAGLEAGLGPHQLAAMRGGLRRLLANARALEAGAPGRRAARGRTPARREREGRSAASHVP